MRRRTCRDRWRALPAVLLCLLGPSLCLAVDTAPDSTTQEPADWPGTIARLRQQSQQMPGHAGKRLELATAYNNYGVQLVNEKKHREAKVQLEEAMRLEPHNPQFRANLVTLNLNVAAAAHDARDLATAKATIDKVLTLDPNQPFAYALLGEIEYQAQRLKEAKRAWEKTLELDPSMQHIQKKLEQVTQELPVESTFDRITQFSFDVRYAEELKSPMGYDIRDVLLRARREVGNDFALWPKYKLVVLVYTEAQFRQLRAHTPDWVAGQYDGKIRIPWPNQDLTPEAVTRILYHEYTHALVHDLTGDKCPTWFNEGLATYEAWKDTPSPAWPALQAAFKDDRLIPWDQMSSWFRYERSTEDVQLAYEQAHSVVQYLARRYGFWRLRRILHDLGQGMSLEATFKKHLPVKPDRLPKEWRSWLKEQLAGS